MNGRGRKEAQYFCQNMKRLREKHGLDQGEMGKRLRIGRETVLTIEKGKIPRLLSCGILFRIQKEFGVRPQDMFAECGEADETEGEL